MSNPEKQTAIGVQGQLKDFYYRFERVGRFGTVGVAVSLLNTALTVGFLKSGLIRDPAIAISIATLMTMPVSFTIHRRITYADAPACQRQWPRFVLLSLSSLVCGAAAMKAAQAMHGSYWLGLAFAWVAIPTANYLMNAFYVFRVRTLLRLERADAEDAR
jgi:putative flippase GtrA